MNWEPRLLFPELCTTSTPISQSTLNSTRANPQKVLKPVSTVPNHQLRRTTRGRIHKKTNGQSGMGNLDSQAFIDVPLDYAEGRQILKMIGSTNISIQPHLINPNPMADPPSDPQHKGKSPSPYPSPSRSGPSHRGLSLLAPPYPGLSFLALFRSNLTCINHAPQWPLPQPDGHSFSQPNCLTEPPHPDPPLKAQSPLQLPTSPAPSQLLLHPSAEGKRQSSHTGDNEEDDPYLDNVDYTDDDHEPLC